MGSDDNSDLLEAYFQAVLAEGNTDNILEFLEIASKTDDDKPFRARLKYANKEPLPKVKKPEKELTISEQLKELADTLPVFRRFLQRTDILSVLFNKYPDVYKRVQGPERLYALTLSSDVEDWLDAQVKTGRFKDRSEAIEYNLSEAMKKGRKYG